MMTCYLCGGPLALLGRLAGRLHFRCRDCGIDQSARASDVLDRGDDEGE